MRQPSQEYLLTLLDNVVVIKNQNACCVIIMSIIVFYFRKTQLGLYLIG